MAAYERVFGPESSEVGWGLTALAEIDRRQGELTRARESIDRALGIYGKVLEAGRADWIWPLHISGKILFAEGRREEAIAELERALANARSQESDESYMIGLIEASLAEFREGASGASLLKPTSAGPS